MAREALVKNRTAAKNRAKNLTLPSSSATTPSSSGRSIGRSRHRDGDPARLSRPIPSLADRFAILVPHPRRLHHHRLRACSSPCPNSAPLDNGQAASLAGLAPVARQSGHWTGRAFIRGGRADVRQALYMPALVAMRFNPDLKAKYDHLIETGKPAKKALTAIMRKLIVLANALLRGQSTLDAKHLP